MAASYHLKARREIFFLFLQIKLSLWIREVQSFQSAAGKSIFSCSSRTRFQLITPSTSPNRFFLR